MRPASRRARPHDPTVYPVEEKVGEDTLQRAIVELLRPLVERWLAHRRRRAFVGADQFIYWKQFDPHQRVSPDVYVLPGVDPTAQFGAWKTWERAIVPSFCFELVSTDWRKDYADNPTRYGSIGVTEFVIYDPWWAERREGLRWQVYRRVGRRGLVRVEATNADRIRSRVLGCWLREVPGTGGNRVRLASGLRGDALFPTAEEAERAAKEAERAEKEAERAAREAERTEKEAERAAKEVEQAAREAERTAKESERAAKESALAERDAERRAKEALLVRVRELEARLARSPSPKPRSR